SHLPSTGHVTISGGAGEDPITEASSILSEGASQSFTCVGGTLPAVTAPGFLAGQLGENDFASSVPSSSDTDTVNSVTSQSFTCVGGTLPAATAPSFLAGQFGEGDRAGQVLENGAFWQQFDQASASGATPSLFADHSINFAPSLQNGT